MISKEEKDQFGRRCDEQENQSLIQSDPAFKDALGEPTNTNAAMKMRLSPGFQDCIHGLANYLPISLGALLELLEEIIGDPCLQRGFQCLR